MVTTKQKPIINTQNVKRDKYTTKESHPPPQEASKRRTEGEIQAGSIGRT